MELFAELNREQIGAAAPDALAVLPLGATEQHGPHLPTGTDYFAIESIAQEAAALVPAEIPLIVAPALPFGSSDHHFVFGGTLSLSTETYYRVLRELVESLVTDGFTRIFLLNGHGGNHELAQLAARDVALKHPVRVAAGSYWTIAWEALVAADAHHTDSNPGRRLPGHAGDFETSLVLSLRPDLVAAERPHRDCVPASNPPWRYERHGFWREIDGFTDSPDHATADKGNQFRRIVAQAVADAFTRFYAS